MLRDRLSTLTGLTMWDSGADVNRRKRFSRSWHVPIMCKFSHCIQLSSKLSPNKEDLFDAKYTTDKQAQNWAVPLFNNAFIIMSTNYFLCFQLPVISVVLMEANKLRDFFLGTCPPLDDPAADPANLAALFWRCSVEPKSASSVMRLVPCV